MKQVARTDLLRIAMLVKPAVATKDYIAALMCIKFDGDYATAHNDISAIAVKAEVDIKRCVPGDLLTKALASFTAENVSLAYDDEKHELLVKCGRASIKLPTMALNKFPFELPSDTEPEVVLTADVLKGIERCLIGSGNDPKNPGTEGVTLDAREGLAELYSTDSTTLSRYRTDAPIELPGDSPVIMPNFFCEQLLALHKAYPKDKVILVLMANGLLADFGPGSASLHTKRLIDVEPINFPRKFNGIYEQSKVVGDLIPVPDSMDSAVERALMVLSPDFEKTTRFKTLKDTISMHSSSKLGDSDDDLEVKGYTFSPVEVNINPSHLSRALKVCDKIAIYPRMVAMTGDDGKFVHLISPVVPAKP